MRILIILALCFMSSLAWADTYYFSPYTGDGSEATPFKAHGVSQGAECKSLRPDETQQAGFAICRIAGSAPVAAGVVSIDPDAALTNLQKIALAAVLGRAVTETTVGEAIGALTTSNNVSLFKWKDGRQKLILKGKELWSQQAPLASYFRNAWQFIASVVQTPAAWAASVLDETFTCADDSDGSYSCSFIWSRATGSVAAIVSNAAATTNSTATQRLKLSNDNLGSTDMTVRAEVASIARGTATNVAGGPIARHHETDTTYVYCVARDAATQEIEYGHIVTGTQTVDGTVSATVSNGDTVTVRAVGDQLSCLHNGATVLGPITENTGNGNVAVGLRFSGSGTATTTSVVLDNVHAEVVSSRRSSTPMVMQ
jgi:hypothetical protein